MPRPNNWKPGDDAASTFSSEGEAEMPRPDNSKPVDDDSLKFSSERKALQMMISYLEDWRSRQSVMLEDANKTIVAAKSVLPNAHAPDCSRVDGSGVIPRGSQQHAYSFEPSSNENNDWNQNKELVLSAATPLSPGTIGFRSVNDAFQGSFARGSSLMTLVEPPPSMLPKRIKTVVDYMTSTAHGLLKSHPEPTGWLVEVIRGRAFEMLFVGVILANVLVLILSTDSQIQNAVEGLNNKGDTFDRFEEMFTCLYVFEMACRLYAHRIRFVLTTDWRWNLLDTLLTLLAIQDFIVAATASSNSKSNLNFLRLVRLLKLLKTLRLLRILRAFRDLRIMLNSIVGSIYVMTYALVLITIVMFAFGIFLSQGVGIYLSENDSVDTVAENLLVYYWGSVSVSMASLYMAVLGGENWRTMADSLITIGHGFRLAFFAFVAFFLLVIVNTVTSVFVESAIQAGEKDSHSQIKEEMEKIHTYVGQFKNVFRRMDLNNDGIVDYDELLASLDRHEMIALMSKLMIDVHDAKQFLREVSVQGQSEINLDTFVAQCLKIRGFARSIDLISFAAAQQNANVAILTELSTLRARSDMIEQMLMNL